MALAGDIHIRWGDDFMKLIISPARYEKTHKGEGQNVLHIGGDVQWYMRLDTRNDNTFYTGVPKAGSPANPVFTGVDE